MTEGFGREKERPLFMIRVVSQMLDVHPQTLRIYEKEGFITPSRAGGRRVYSQADVERLRLILDLTREMGVNRAGFAIVENELASEAAKRFRALETLITARRWKR